MHGDGLMTILDNNKHDFHASGPSFSLGHRIYRAIWNMTWAILASWTPPPLHGWRRFLLRLFGAKIGKYARVYGTARIWYPPELIMDEGSCIGPRAIIYNQGQISIGSRSTISQGAHLCAGTHDFRTRSFQLVVRPIRIAEDVWVAAEAFVGPGVTIPSGTVVGARTVVMKSLEAWSIYSGNPAVRLGDRILK